MILQFIKKTKRKLLEDTAIILRLEVEHFFVLLSTLIITIALEEMLYH